jgi:hypothetical protein
MSSANNTVAGMATSVIGDSKESSEQSPLPGISAYSNGVRIDRIDDYYLVPKVSGALSVKTAQPESKAVGLKSNMNHSIAFKSARSVAIKLAVVGQASSVGGASQAPVVSLDPSTSSQWAMPAALFDEYKVTSARVKWYVAYGAPSSPVDAFVVLCTDLTTSAALTSVAEGVSFAQNQVINVGNNVSPLSQNAGGFMTYMPQLPKGPLASSASGTSPNVDPSFASSGIWTYTGVTTKPAFGVLKWFIPSFGGSVITILNYIIEYNVTFRSRAA